MIHDVESFEAELEVVLFGYGEALQQGHVDVVDAILAEVSKGRGEGADMVLELVRGTGVFAGVGVEDVDAFDLDVDVVVG